VPPGDCSQALPGVIAYFKGGWLRTAHVGFDLTNEAECSRPPRR